MGAKVGEEVGKGAGVQRSNPAGSQEKASHQLISQSLDLGTAEGPPVPPALGTHLSSALLSPSPAHGSQEVI